MALGVLRQIHGTTVVKIIVQHIFDRPNKGGVIIDQGQLEVQAERPIVQVYRATLPFLILLIFTLLLITYWPALSLMLPDLLKN